MEREKLLRNLKQVREKEKNKKYLTGQLNVFDMVSDVINYLEHEEKPKMTNLEYIKKNFNKFSFSDDKPVCEIAYMKEYSKDCEGGNCKECKFNHMEDAIDYLLQEHKESIKLKQWEKDLISLFDKGYNKEYSFSSFLPLNGLKRKGYFKGIKDMSMKVKDILNNHIIVSDDYEGFEDCK